MQPSDWISLLALLFAIYSRWRGWQEKQRGDMLAFEELVARHRDKIYARAFTMMRNEDEALDLSQEAWIKGWQRIGQFEGESSFATWMTRITINLCLDHLRRNQRYRVERKPDTSEDVTGLDRFLPPVWTNPTERLERAELRVRIDAALAKPFDEATDLYR